MNARTHASRLAARQCGPTDASPRLAPARTEHFHGAARSRQPGLARLLPVRAPLAPGPPAAVHVRSRRNGLRPGCPRRAASTAPGTQHCPARSPCAHASYRKLDPRLDSDSHRGRGKRKGKDVHSKAGRCFALSWMSPEFLGEKKEEAGVNAPGCNGGARATCQGRGANASASEAPRALSCPQCVCASHPHRSPRQRVAPAHGLCWRPPLKSHRASGHGPADSRQLGRALPGS